jgi:hypothetical protein
MSHTSLIKATPWDTVAFGLPTWELVEYSLPALQQAEKTPGHHTLKVDPLADKSLLYEFGFYYCDTLVEPFCCATRLRSSEHPDATISKEFEAKQALAICHGAFVHGRFHRDFNVSKTNADQRYDNWLEQLLKEKQVYGLHWRGELAGFIANNANNLVLHALAEKYRGKGLSKYWWSSLSRQILAAGHEKVKSSISATNLQVFNLYASLGFSFGNPTDIYHRLVR